MMGYTISDGSPNGREMVDETDEMEDGELMKKERRGRSLGGMPAYMFSGKVGLPV